MPVYTRTFGKTRTRICARTRSFSYLYSQLRVHRHCSLTFVRVLARSRTRARSHLFRFDSAFKFVISYSPTLEFILADIRTRTWTNGQIIYLYLTIDRTYT